MFSPIHHSSSNYTPILTYYFVIYTVEVFIKVSMTAYSYKYIEFDQLLQYTRPCTYLPLRTFYASARNPTDGTNMAQIKSDISEFGCILGKIYWFYCDPRIQSMPKTRHMRPDSVRVAFGIGCRTLADLLQSCCRVVAESLRYSIGILQELQ